MNAHIRQVAIDAARLNLAEVEDCLFWIERHEATLRAPASYEKPEYLAAVRRQLAFRYRRYLEFVRLYTLHLEAAGIKELAA